MVLIELLVALSIVAIMSAVMAGFLGQLRTVGRVGDEVAIRAELSAAADHLARTISAARAMPLSAPEARAGTDTNSRGQPALVGEGAGLRFVAVTPRGFSTNGLSEVTIASRRAGGELSLIEILRPARPGGASIVAEVVVIEGLDGAEFSYVDADGAVRAAWSEEKLPVGVRITLTRDHSNRPVSVRDFASLN
ncbi:hypothetical protein [Palleronia marisminoris]|uniref:hypothetical protein n=1 Tax=Palleronia marisminoris TaxID=315423 RepID=UPI000A271818|nr:hypothetical protein [Palleronia marisminoris]